MQSYADRKDTKKFIDALKTVYGPHSSETTPLLSADGTSLLTDKEVVSRRQAEHFNGVLNRPSSLIDEAINRLPKVKCNPLLDEFPTISEIVKAIKLLSFGKAPDSDAIHAEIYNRVITHYVEKRRYPSKAKGASIIHLFKRTIIEASLYC